MQHERHPGVAVGEHDERQYELQKHREDPDRLLGGLVRPLWVDRAVAGLSDLRRRRHVGHIEARPDHPDYHQSHCYL